MHEERVEFFSEGTRVAGLLRLPEGGAGPLPAIVQGPGWLGLADAKAYVPWHTALVDAGYAVLAFDYRGHGESDGERGWILPARMVEDVINAVTYLETRPEVARDRIGAFGIGATGAGNAIIAAASDPRIRCVAVQSVIADGAVWLRGMRREYEWIELRERVAEDARTWVRSGDSKLVNPRTEIMVAAPERARYSGKKDVDSRVDPLFHLQSAAAIMRYRPIDVVHRLAPRALLVISVEDDTVTPDEHALALYERAGSPKRLVRQLGTTHYESYTRNYELLAREIVSWYDQHLTVNPVQTFEDSPND
jgi:dipeptidyl aminopeptidase/acylaminoacyl peptidase